ncbi:MAG: Rrf2 family transcriptional regulator [Rhodospirillaceae bacterium]
MRLTRYTDFCFRVLIHAGLKDGSLSTTREISDRYGISSNHLMKVVYDLNIKGYLETVRGKNGGIRLGRLPEQINLGTLIRDIEDDMALVECHTSESQCRIGSACLLRGVIGEGLRAFLGVLDRYTLADLLEPRADLSRLLDIEVDRPVIARRAAR